MSASSFEKLLKKKLRKLQRKKAFTEELPIAFTKDSKKDQGRKAKIDEYGAAVPKRDGEREIRFQKNENSYEKTRRQGAGRSIEGRARSACGIYPGSNSKRPEHYLDGQRGTGGGTS